jgi:hypothetical protein
VRSTDWVDVAGIRSGIAEWVWTIEDIVLWLVVPRGTDTSASANSSTSA